MQMKPDVEALAFSPDRAAMRIGESVRSVYNLLSTGQLKSYKAGKRRLIPDTELQAYVKRRLAGSDGKITPAVKKPRLKA